MEPELQPGNVLHNIPELLFQDQILDNILKDVTFFSFFEDIYSNPDAYTILNSKQKYWKEYLIKNYPEYYQNLISNPSFNEQQTNWFNETIIIGLNHGAKYYYYDKNSILFSYLHQENQKQNIRKDINVNHRVLSKEFLFLDKFTINDATQDIPFEKIFPEVLDPNIKQIYRTYPANIHILFSSGEYFILAESTYNEGYILRKEFRKILVMKNVKKIITSAFIYILNYDGELYVEVTTYDDNRRKLNLPFLVDDINKDSGYPPDPRDGERIRHYLLSLVDKKGNLYAIDSYDYLINEYAVNHPFDRSVEYKRKNSDGTLETFRENITIDQGIENNIPYYKYAMIHQGDVHHVDDPNHNNDPLSTNLYFIGTNKKLYQSYHTNYELINDINIIPTFTFSFEDPSYDPRKEPPIDKNNVLRPMKIRPKLIKKEVLVKNIWVKKIRLHRLRDYSDVCFYSDYDGNIYQINSIWGFIFIRQYQFPPEIEDKYVRQFIIDESNGIQVLIFVTEKRIYFHQYIHEDFRYDNIIFIDPLQEFRDIPPGTKIINSDRMNISIDRYFGPLLRVPTITDHVLIPYPLYLLNHLQGNVVTDITKGDSIIFKLKNSKYVYRTTIK